MAVTFQTLNSISIGGYLAGYGPTTRKEWNYAGNYKAGGRIELGLMIWAIGFFLSIWHDDELREIRRAAKRNQLRRATEAEESTGKGKAANGRLGIDKFYLIPKNGAFKYILYPHYLFEWLEWTGFYIFGGLLFVPGRTFLINEIATMLPRAVRGKWWYVERFGKEKVGSRKAIIPGLL
jgi:3-oxo-5-alpha-steroid 4-dehydrogenase 1